MIAPLENQSNSEQDFSSCVRCGVAWRGQGGPGPSILPWFCVPADCGEGATEIRAMRGQPLQLRVWQGRTAVPCCGSGLRPQTPLTYVVGVFKAW